MNILITGSNGFVGSVLIWRLQEHGHNVIGIDISKYCEAKAPPNTMIGDIRKANDLETIHQSFFEKYKDNINLIVHCAAAKHDFGITEQEYYSHNESGTKILLEYMERKGIIKLVNFSTVSVFGHPDNRTDEDGVFAPDHPYGASKLAGELLCTQWQQADPTRELVVLRPTVIYGPNNFANVYKMIDMMHRRPIAMLGKGNYVKSIVSLANVLDMTVFAMSALNPGAQYFNCVDKPYITLRQLMEIIALNKAFKVPRLVIPVWLAILIGKLFDIPAKLFNIDLPINSDRMYKLATATDFASERIREAGYVQGHSIEDEIKATTDWYLSLRKKG
jgi:nucleoside-diphosphate-sugar epimerase